jgi:hypothetical protein
MTDQTNLENKVDKSYTAFRNTVLISGLSLATFWGGLISGAYSGDSAEIKHCAELGAYAIGVGGAYALYNIGKGIKYAVKQIREKSK